MNKVIHDSEVLKEGQQVITACAFIYQDFDGVTKVFLPKRALTKKFLPGVYELPGGHIDFGEDIVVGLKREVKEEFDMEIEVLETFSVFTYVNEIKKSHSIEVVYFAKFISPLGDIKFNTEDHSGYEWVAESELGRILENNKAIHTKGENDPEYLTIKKGFELLYTKNK